MSKTKDPLNTMSKDLMDALSVICHWTNYQGTHCRRTIQKDSILCPMHMSLVADYSNVVQPDNDEDEPILCDSHEFIKIPPRSFKHIKKIQQQLGSDDDIVQVIVKGSTGDITEDADISNQHYIKLDSDDTMYYYKPRGLTQEEKKNGTQKQKSASDIKVVFKKMCPNLAVVCARDENLCESCYKKLKNIPKLSVIKQF